MSTRESSQTDIWSYRQGTLIGEDIDTDGLVGYKVEALDGSIGEVDDATFDAGSSHLVVDTGGWIFGKKVLLPAGVVRRVEKSEEKVYVNRSKDQIKHAPEFDEYTSRDDVSYLTSLGAHYGPGGAGYQDWDDPR